MWLNIKEFIIIIISFFKFLVAEIQGNLIIKKLTIAFHLHAWIPLQHQQVHGQGTPGSPSALVCALLK